MKNKPIHFTEISSMKNQQRITFFNRKSYFSQIINQNIDENRYSTRK